MLKKLKWIHGMDEMMTNSVEYDLDEEVAEDEVVEEATKLQDNAVALPKGGEADSKESTKAAPKKTLM